MDKPYVDTVRLLLAIAPEVFRGGVFAMKGGTAINLFVHDMPRLSVDIDLAYPDWKKPRNQALRSIADEFALISQRLRRLGFAVRSVDVAELGESKLIIDRDGVQVKVEVNLVFRGTVQPLERRSLSPMTAELFSAELSVPSLALDELYGSKLVAALDRQHPRDFFDMARMYEAHGLSDAAIECFVLYLAGHNRPIHEVLAPRRKNIAREFESSFAGMTREPVEFASLEAVRDRLLEDLPARLTADQRAFLIGLARAEPNWSIVACPHASDLPAIRWRLRNLEQFRMSHSEKFASQVRALEEVLGR